jgi:transcriptional regulator with XRE-family HTH domain
MPHIKADQVDKIVARNIRTWRIERAFTLKVMAERIGVTYQLLQKYENGGCRVSAGRLWRIAEVLGVPILVLFDGVICGTKSQILDTVP